VPKSIFDLLSPVYDWIIRGAPPEHLAEYLSLSGNCEEDILEIGAGTGRAVRDLVDNCRSLWLLDPSLNMLRVAKKKIPKAKIVHAYTENIPLPDNSFDRIFAIDSLHHWDDHLSALSEIDRVLDPHGRFVLIDYDPTTKRGYFIKSMEWTLRMGSTFFTPSQIKSLLYKSGLKVIKQKFIDSGTYLTVSIPM
jgi:demethylmenaquinone methyltransferase/2-methoxy-6-polyprenyl-1,4-benzoquinol methylase